MQIFVLGAFARNIVLNVESFTTIKHVKSQLDAKLGIPWTKQRLLYGGRQLDDDRTLEHYGTRNEDTFRLSLSGLLGGGAYGSKRKYRVNPTKRWFQCPGAHMAVCYSMDLLSSYVVGSEKVNSLMNPELERESQDAMKAIGMLMRTPPKDMNTLYLEQVIDFWCHLSSAVPADMAQLKQKIGKAMFKLTLLSVKVPPLSEAMATPSDPDPPEAVAVEMPDDDARV